MTVPVIRINQDNVTKTHCDSYQLTSWVFDRKGIFILMNKAIAMLLVMVMLIMAMPCAALAETSAEPQASETETSAEPEASEQPEESAEAALTAAKAGAASIAASAGETIISALSEHFDLGIFGDIGSTLFGALMEGIFGDDTEETLIEMLTQIQQQLNELSRKIDEQTQEIKRAITDSELSSDLRKVNEIYAQTDRLYADYSSILAIDDEELRARELDNFFKNTVPKANLRSMMTTCGSYLTKSSGGSPSLCSMYFDSCCDTYLFEHQMANGISAFYIYHLGNMLKMLMLYNDWCEYTAADKSDPNDAKMLELKRAAADVGKIYAAMSAQLHIYSMTADIAHSGTDALGNSVNYYIVRLNSDHRRYVVVDKAYSYSTFYGKGKETFGYVDQVFYNVRFIQSQKTSGYDKLMTTPPTNKKEVLTGIVIANPKDADSFYAKAARNGILSYLESYGMKLSSANTKKAMAFVFSDQVAHSAKTRDLNGTGVAGSLYGVIDKKKIISNESYYLHYFMSNADEKKLIKDIKYSQNIDSSYMVWAPNIGKYEDAKLSGGNTQLLVYADYCNDFYSKNFYNFPMYLVYKLDEDLEYTNGLNTQAGGVFEMYLWGINVWWFIGAAIVIIAAAVMVVILRKRKKGSK